MAITSENIICEMENNNKIIGHYPETINSSINFLGHDNILYCEKNVRLCDSKLTFAGNNSVIYLCSSSYPYKLSVDVYNDSVFHMGENNYISNTLSVILSEQKHCLIGDNGAFSDNISIRNADSHLIYKCSTKNRLNISKSIYIGDHVWIGQDARIFKGTQVDSGSIIGAMSVVSGKKIPHNSTWAGNPCKQIDEDIFWDSSCVHDWTQNETTKSMNYAEFISEYKHDCPENFGIYEFNTSEYLGWEDLENAFSSQSSSLDKCQYLIHLNECKTKNRFVHSS